MDRERIADLIEELDRVVPHDGAEVLFVLVGGGREAQMAATETGYLRFGLAAMKGAFAPFSGGKNRHEIQVDLADLISEESDFSFQSFERVDPLDPTPEPSRAQRLVDGLLGWAAFAGCLAFVVLALIGLGTAVDWMLR